MQFALNDAFIGCPLAEFEKNSTLIVDRLQKETAAELLLLTSVALADPHEDSIALQSYERLEQVAQQRSVLYCAGACLLEEKDRRQL